VGTINYLNSLKNKIFFIYYFVYVLFFFGSIYIAKIVIIWRNEFISENCDIVFRGYIFQDNSLLLLIMSFILFIFLISNVLIFEIIESRYKKQQWYYIVFQTIILLILLIFYLLIK